MGPKRAANSNGSSLGKSTPNKRDLADPQWVDAATGKPDHQPAVTDGEFTDHLFNNLGLDLGAPASAPSGSHDWQADAPPTPDQQLSLDEIDLNGPELVFGGQSKHDPPDPKKKPPASQRAVHHQPPAALPLATHAAQRPPPVAKSPAATAPPAATSTPPPFASTGDRPESAKATKRLNLPIKALIFALSGGALLWWSVRDYQRQQSEARVSLSSAKLEVMDLTSAVYALKEGGSVYVVRGVLQNRSPARQGPTKVVVELRQGDQVLRKAEAALGQAPSLEDIYMIASAAALTELEQKLAAKAGPIDAGSRAEFMAVFYEYPENIADCSLHVSPEPIRQKP